MAHVTNPLATPDQLYKRSSFSALPSDIQDIIFYTTQCLTQAAGILLQLPQSVTAQANVVLARYWLVEPVMSHDFATVSAACIYLVSKLGPSPSEARDVANVYAYLRSPSSPFLRPKSPSQPPPTNDPKSYFLSETEYSVFHSDVLGIEARVLYALSFDTHVSLPHPLAITYLQALDFLAHPRTAISARTLEHLNTALLSPQQLYVTHQPNALAVAAIYIAAKEVGAKAPDSEWWEVFDVDREELGFLVVAMRSVEVWARKQQGEAPKLMSSGLVTRELVEEELRSRGIQGGNRGDAIDKEEELMRKMDERMVQIQGEK